MQTTHQPRNRTFLNDTPSIIASARAARSAFFARAVREALEEAKGKAEAVGQQHAAVAAKA